MVPGVNTLINSFGSNITIKKFRIIFDSKDKLLVFTKFFPDVRKVVFDSEIVRSDVEKGLSMSDHSNFGLLVHGLT